jgi:hypothetical protein
LDIDPCLRSARPIAADGNFKRRRQIVSGTTHTQRKESARYCEQPTRRYAKSAVFPPMIAFSVAAV